MKHSYDGQHEKMNNFDPPIISVVIPTCHRNDLLAKCLDCLAPGVQTLPPKQYEVIVTDDGSHSTAEQIVRECYPWARWLEGPHKGPAANRNNGASHAQGEWLVFTDDDCLPKPEWLAAYIAEIVPGTKVYEGKTTCEQGIRSPMEQAPVNLSGGWLWSCNMMLQREVFQELGGFDETFPQPHLEDVDLRERIKQAKHTFFFVEKAVVDHPPRRVHGGKKLGAYHESEVMFWARQKQPRPLAALLLILIMGRVRTIISFRPSRDSLYAAVSLIVELSYMLWKMPEWRRKHGW